MTKTVGGTQALLKRPGETKTYHVLFEDMLDGDTISTVASTVPAGITEDTAAAKNATALVVRGVTYTANTAVSIGLSGGTEGEVYVIEIEIVTTAGDTHEYDLVIAVVADYVV